MAHELEGFTVDTFSLTSSNDVVSTMQEVTLVNRKNLIIHISSFIHNTVLVQTLKQNLMKEYPNTKISLIKSSDKSKTVLNIFSADEVQGELLHDTVLNELYSNYQIKDDSAVE